MAHVKSFTKYIKRRSKRAKNMPGGPSLMPVHVKAHHRRN